MCLFLRLQAKLDRGDMTFRFLGAFPACDFCRESLAESDNSQKKGTETVGSWVHPGGGKKRNRNGHVFFGKCAYSLGGRQNYDPYRGRKSTPKIDGKSIEIKSRGTKKNHPGGRV